MAQENQPEASCRLPHDVIPEHYDLTIKTDLETLSFSGRVIIDVNVANPTNTWTLSCGPELKVKEALLLSNALKTSTSIPATSIEQDSKAERVTLSFDKADSVAKDAKAKLAITFEAPLGGKMMGYYKAAHKPDNDDQTHYYALTQFEATSARAAFPCWDEPSFKSTFTVSLISRKGTVSLSNNPVSSTTPCSGEVPAVSSPAYADESKGPSASDSSDWELVQFEPMPKMSTYLVAWANGYFKHLEDEVVSPLTGRKIPLRIYATKENIHQAGLALDVAKRVLPVYEKLFDIPYPLPKLDTLVASDFDAGAMENWGLLAGRTSVYLFDDEKGAMDARKWVTAVQSHEVAHQWFGNITTMKWWDNLWLNEAFATLMGEVVSINELHPEWNPHSDFLKSHLSRALGLDAQRSSHPIEMPCPNEATIAQIFDSISYSKGAAVLKMLSNMIGEKVFLKGVSNYLKAHLYDNAETKDLWKGISEASGKDVATIMANWTLKIGFPVVTVEETAEGLKIRQNRFLSTGDCKPEEDETLWHIPLELKTKTERGAEVDHNLILSEREMTIPLKDVANATYKFNAETCGVYRVLYPEDRWVKQAAEASSPNGIFSSDDRVGLVADAVTLAKSGHLRTSATLDLLTALSQETSDLVWTEIAGGLTSMRDIFWEQPTEVRQALNKVSCELFEPIVGKLGFEVSKSDSSQTRALRTLAIGSAAAAEHKPTTDEILSRFHKGDEAIPGDLLDVIFVNAVRYGGEKELQACFDVIKNPKTPQHKIAAMLAVCATRNDKLIERGFEYLASGEVKMQDESTFFAGFARNPISRRKLYAYVEKNLDDMATRYKGNFTLGRLIGSSFSSLTTAEDADKVESFFKDKDTTTYNQALAQGLESVRSKAAWLQRDKEDIISWLKKKQYLA